jgi:hypothetical protein
MALAMALSVLAARAVWEHGILVDTKVSFSDQETIKAFLSVKALSR